MSIWQRIKAWFSPNHKDMLTTSNIRPRLPQTQPTVNVLPPPKPPVISPPVLKVVPKLPETDFDRAIAFVLLQEDATGKGVVSDLPNDKGGLTKWGIALNDNPEFTRDQLIHLSKNDAQAFYHKKFWIPEGCYKFAWPLCLVLLDTSVNMGVYGARRLLSESQGNTPKLRALDMLAKRKARYLEIEKDNPKDKMFNADWMGRIAACQKVVNIA